MGLGPVGWAREPLEGRPSVAHGVGFDNGDLSSRTLFATVSWKRLITEEEPRTNQQRSDQDVISVSHNALMTTSRGGIELPNSWVNGGAARCRNLPARTGNPTTPALLSHPLASGMHDSLQ